SAVDIGLGCLHLGSRCLDAASRPTEEVELPEGIEARLIIVLIPICSWERHLPLTRSRLHPRGALRHRRSEIEPRPAAQRTRLSETRHGDRYVVIRPQPLLDQPIEERIIECSPKFAFDLVIIEPRPTSADELVNGHHLRSPILRTDRTCRH